KIASCHERERMEIPLRRQRGPIPITFAQETERAREPWEALMGRYCAPAEQKCSSCICCVKRLNAAENAARWQHDRGIVSEVKNGEGIRGLRQKTALELEEKRIRRRKKYSRHESATMRTKKTGADLVRPRWLTAPSA
ncbi:MAG TPA: hypothetical protein VJP02_13970, partial [Candidatus Sulfotelmatobacter sp.]|nr:hypothetical protein [Candidatus Sulfotelmatobacter sp.]